MDYIGRYKIVRELGRGAMGVVYHAIDPNIGRPVAIKTIQLGGNRKPEEQERLRERLFREARSAGILSHPGIVTIYDVEQQGDLAYIAMEYVDGPTLDALLSQPSAIEPGLMYSILAQTAIALDYAHQKGIVHRDIKPANIMIAGANSGAPGTVKITDFGIAKVTASEQFTMTGAIVGTPHYMSPEQVQGQAVDGRSDQFSLAVIAYEMLTGEKPYTGEHLTTVVYKIVAEEPAPPHRVNPTLGGPIEATLKKGLAKKPDARFRTCQEFTDALEKACEASVGWKPLPRGGGLNEPTLAEVKKPTIALPPSRRRVEAAASAAEDAPRKRGFGTFLVAMVAVAGLLALIGWQAAPTFFKRQAARDTESAAEVKPPETVPPPVAETKPAETAASDAKPSPVPPAAPPADDKPETKPETKPEEAAREAPARQTPTPRAERGPQSVMVISSPGGATATLDGKADTACTTPCNIEAAPGRHTIAINLAGYQLERREVDVGSSSQEMPAIVLQPVGGSLWLSSVPSGASISINGKKVSQLTPAQLPLAPGTYKVVVEKDGKQAARTVDVRSGISYLKVLFDQQ